MFRSNRMGGAGSFLGSCPDAWMGKASSRQIKWGTSCLLIYLFPQVHHIGPQVRVSELLEKGIVANWVRFAGSNS